MEGFSRESLRLLRRVVLDTALPADCPVCLEPLGEHRAGVCANCWREVVEMGTPRDPRPARQETPGRFLASLTTLGSYDGRLRSIIRQLKFGDMPGLGAPLGERLASRLEGIPGGFDLVVPVPLHWRRRWRRGYNQAEMIAARVALLAGRPILPGALRRLKATAPQTGRNRRERVANIRGAFMVRSTGRGARQARDLKDATVLLVDDVVTTGATIRECARALKGAGARNVQAAAAARTLSSNWIMG